MFESEKDLIKAVQKTRVARKPLQYLDTFGTTIINYYVITEPIYSDIDELKKETVVRTGRVNSGKPEIVTPTYALNLKGFSSEAYKYLEFISNKFGVNSPGVLYQYKNEPGKINILNGSVEEVSNNIIKELNTKKDKLTAVIVGVDELWDVSLLKFIHDFTSESLVSNINEFNSRGLLQPQDQFGGVPKAAVQRIEILFNQVGFGADPEILKKELDRWGLFDHYEERFLNLFK
tara:strand:- start:3 stop:701 length:699 start_codon:yes stop_codon:yes gene_type:complete